MAKCCVRCRSPRTTLSDGWLCDRGRYNVGFYSDGRRLTTPLLRDGDSWAQISWDDAIALWATRLRGAALAGGGASIAALGSGRLTNEEAYLLQLITRALGSENLDWRVRRQRQASPGPFGGTYADLENAQTIVVIGRPPGQTAPVMDLRIRKAVAQHGARLFVVGEQRCDSAIPYTRIAKVDELSKGGALAAERYAFVWDGIDVVAGASANAAMKRLAGAGKHVAAFIAGDSMNARGVEAMGLLPRAAGLDAAGIFEAAQRGKIGVLSIFGANPVVHSPAGPDDTRATLANIPFVVVSELFLTETASLATLVLPARGPFEKAGHVFDVTGGVRPVRSATAAPPETLADGDMLIALAAELGIALPSPSELEARATAPVEPATGFADPAICGAPPKPAGKKKNDGLHLSIASDPFAGAGTLRHDDRLHELWVRPHVAMSEATAASAGVAAGDLIDLAAGARTLHDLRVRIAAGVPAGVLSIVDGLWDAPAADLAGGETVVAINRRAARAPVGASA